MSIIKRESAVDLQKSYRRSDWPGDINYVEILPAHISVDDHDFLGIEGGVFQNVIECIDFKGTPTGPLLTDTVNTGTIWFSFNFPQKWQTNMNILFYLYYSMDGDAVGKDVALDCNTWVVGLGGSVDRNNPTTFSRETITTSVGLNLGIFAKEKLESFVIDETSLLSKEAIITCSIRRRPDLTADTYEGDFKLMKVIARQI